MRSVATADSVYGPTAQAVLASAPIGIGVQGHSLQDNGGIQKANGASPIPVTSVFGNLKNSVFGQPLTWLFGLIGVLIAYKLLEEHRGGKEAFEEIKIGLNNMWKIGLMAMLFFVVARFITNRYQIPGVSSFIQYATGTPSATPIAQ